MLVVTVVHHPLDARIRFREIAALLDAGWQVTYAAPLRGYGLADDAVRLGSDLTLVDLPRALGRRRLAALRAVRSLLSRRGREHDLVLLHDPELLAALPGLRLPPVVWDVHEDTAAATSLKPWLPRPLRRVVASSVTAAERLAERHTHLILAEDLYQQRFRRPHVVVANTVTVPDTVSAAGSASGPARVLYIGHLTRARGVEVMVAAAQRLADDGERIELHLVGHADATSGSMLEQAQRDGLLRWHGFVPSDQAKAMLDGALAGLSLLRDEPNYQVSMPTKVVEYMAYGVPVVTTPLPLAADLVRGTDSGVVVPFDDPGAVADAVLALRDDPARRNRLGANGHRAARERFDWRSQSTAFVREMERVAGG